MALALALAATAANAQDARLDNRAPAATSANGTRPFLFDGRMRGDGTRQGAPANNRHPATGNIVVPPQPAHER